MSQPRRIAIGDIHGCCITLQYLLEEKLSISPEDQVYFLGDYIDRGPRSNEVILYFWKKLQEGFQFSFLRGNHEHNFIRAHSYGEEFFQKYLDKYKSHDLVGDDMFEVLEFFHQMPFYLEIEGFVLVHAGFNIRRDDPFQDTHSMLNQPFPTRSADFLGGKKIVHGHIVTPLSTIQQQIKDKADVIPLDNGCIYPGEGRGNLCALDLDKMELTYQANLDV